MQIKHKLINKKWYCYEAQYIILNYTFFLINQTSKNKHPPIKLFTSLNFKINIVYFFIFPFIKSLQMHHWSWLNAWSPGLQGYGNYIRLISPDVLTLRPFLKKKIKVQMVSLARLDFLSTIHVNISIWQATINRQQTTKRNNFRFNAKFSQG